MKQLTGIYGWESTTDDHGNVAAIAGGMEFPRFRFQ